MRTHGGMLSMHTQAPASCLSDGTSHVDQFCQLTSLKQILKSESIILTITAAYSQLVQNSLTLAVVESSLQKSISLA